MEDEGLEDQYPDDEDEDIDDREMEDREMGYREMDDRGEPEFNDEYEIDDNYEHVEPEVHHSQENSRGLSGTKSGIIAPARHVEENYEDDTPEETPMKSDRFLEESQKQDNSGGFEEEYEDVPDGSKSMVESMAKSKEISEGFNLGQSQPVQSKHEALS